MCAVAAGGCGGADPLGMDGRKGQPPAERVSSGAEDGERGGAVVAPVPVVVAPALVQAKYADTKPGELPADLARVIASAADHLAKEERRTAFEILVDPRKLESDRTNLDLLSRNTPLIKVKLLEGTLRQALKTPPRLTADGTFVLIPVSDATHVRFEKLEERWRLSERIRPDDDDAPTHAAYLLENLTGVSKREDSWPEPERAVVTALEKDGAGIARGSDSDGRPAVAVVFPHTFRGSKASVTQLKSLTGVRIVAIYIRDFPASGLESLSDLPELTSLRLVHNSITTETLTAAGRLSGLTSLSVNGLQPNNVSLGQLAGLTKLRSLALNYVSFERDELNVLFGMPELRRLELFGSSVDDKCLTILKGLPHLESLMIPTDGVTADGVSALRGAVPNLFLDW